MGYTNYHEWQKNVYTIESLLAVTSLACGQTIARSHPCLDVVLSVV